MEEENNRPDWDRVRELMEMVRSVENAEKGTPEYRELSRHKRQIKSQFRGDRREERVEELVDEDKYDELEETLGLYF